MTVLDFHPDDLIDRDARGLLSADEKRRLGEHLAQCAVCRLELQLRADFDAELGAQPETVRVHDFVSSALVAAREPRQPSEPVQVAAGARRRPLTKRVALLLAASLLLVSGLAAAQSGLVTRFIELARVTIGITPSAAERDAPAAKAKRTHKPSAKHEAVHAGEIARREPLLPAEHAVTEAAPSAHAIPAAPVPTPVAAPTELPGPRVAAPRAAEPVPPSAAPSERRERSRHGRARTSTSTRAARVAREAQTVHAVERETAPPAPVAPEPAPLDASAAGLFERAGAARRAGRWLEAQNFYRELSERHATSAEARLSLVLVARMQLDRGEARAALAGFDAYLATSDTALREEALTGRAVALKKLGRAGEERAAVRELLQHYPDSPYGRRALERSHEGAP